MSAPFPPHTGPRSRTRDERGVVLPTRMMLVAIVVVALGAAMYVATSPGGSTAAAPKDTAKTSVTTTTKSTPKSTTKSTPSPSSPSSKASPKSTSSWLTPTPTPSASKKPSPSAKTPTKVAAPSAVRRGATFVEVFNNTKRKGLAGRTANKAKGVGWKVVGSDNWYGTIPTTTVYYPRGMGRAAKALARDLGIHRVKPTIAPMRSDRLTVILTSDFRL